MKNRCQLGGEEGGRVIEGLEAELIARVKETLKEEGNGLFGGSWRLTIQGSKDGDVE